LFLSLKRVGTFRLSSLISRGECPSALAATLTAPRNDIVWTVAASATPNLL
jgi:hypothetical protein